MHEFVGKTFFYYSTFSQKRKRKHEIVIISINVKKVFIKYKHNVKNNTEKESVIISRRKN